MLARPRTAATMLSAVMALVGALPFGSTACRSEAPAPTPAPIPGDPEPARPDAQGARRIVSLTPSLTDLVVALGAADRLVGVTANCDRAGLSGHDVPSVGDMRVTPERVLAQEPDLVIAASYKFNADQLGALEAAGLPLLALPLDSLNHARAATLALGDRLGAEDRAQAVVAELDAALEAARTHPARTKAPSVLLVFDVADGMVYTTGGGGHLSEIMDAWGTRNVAEGGPLTSRLSLERVLALSPDVIVHVAPGEALPDTAAALAWWKRTPGLPAVEHGKVLVWPNRDLAKHGPGLAREIQRYGELVLGIAPPPTPEATGSK